MGRTFNSAGFGTAFPVAPGMMIDVAFSISHLLTLCFLIMQGMWLTCRHVIDPCNNNLKVSTPSTNMHDDAAWSTGTPLTRLHIVPASQSYINHLVKKDSEPLYSSVETNTDFRGILYD